VLVKFLCLETYSAVCSEDPLNKEICPCQPAVETTASTLIMCFKGGDTFFIPQFSTPSLMPFHPLVLTSGSALYLFYTDTADQPNFQATSCSSSMAVSQNSAQRKAVSKQKSANWTKEETNVLLQACRPNHEKLKTAASS